MDTRYQKWIEEYEEEWLKRIIGNTEGYSHEDLLAIAVRGMCSGATIKMVQAFPELRRVRGHYGGAEHWWCTTPDGEIVDPTARQFRSGLEYVEHTGPEPVGKCMNCGNYVMSYEFTSSACNKDCLDELKAEYGNLR